MIRKSLLNIFIFFFAASAFANAESFKNDSLLAILKNKTSVTQKRDLIIYLRYAFGDMPVKDLNTARQQTAKLLRSFHEQDSDGIIYFVDAICRLRGQDYRGAQNFLLKAIEEANLSNDHYVLYASFTHLAFVNTDEGNVIAAISSFRNAKKEATIVDDAYLQALIDVNLSDTYYRNAMLSHALLCLNEAQSLIDSHHVTNERMQNGINYNKAEVFFQYQNADSLSKYNNALNRAKKGTAGLYTFQKRTDYYLLLLRKQYPKVINIIKTLKNDSLYQFKTVDRQCLADAYFQEGQLDSARSTIVGLINDASEQNHAERTLRFYKLLGDIENKKGDYQQAAGAYNTALAHTWEQLKRLIDVGSISSQIRIDQVQNSYALKTETYKRERLWLIFIITAITLFIIIGALLY
jgi:predicted negative regulator of RcsB-dependent stress response